VSEKDSAGGSAEQEGPATFGPKMLQNVKPPFIPEGASGMTVLVEWPPGDPGTPPHRHSGPCFGYVIEGAVRFELEGEPERVIKAGETLWEPGGDVIHYQNGNALSDAPTKFVVTMLCAPDQPMLTLVEEEELEKRAHLRAPRPSAG
jgi:quercetin dioxygenase-like cupin family protein